jgi:uncharacterized membrane protein
MSVRDAFLALHVAAGSTGLVLGPLAMGASKRRGAHTRIGETYHWVMLTVCVSAAGLAILAFAQLWWFLLIAAFSYANALVGYVAVKRRPRGWLPWHVRGMAGSYIALVTALLVVNFGRQAPIVWILPTILGVPIIRWYVMRQGRRPAPSRT